MKTIILEKIFKTLNSEIDTEVKVLYLFVQVHKVRKLCGERKSVLDYYRDWLVHDEISYKGTTDFFLKRFEAHLTGDDTRKVARVFQKEEADFFKFIPVKTDLENFFRKHNLPDSLTQDANKWFRFIKLLTEMLKECPVNYKNGKIKQLIITDDKNGYICFKFRLRNSKKSIKMKLKIKGLIQ